MPAGSPVQPPSVGITSALLPGVTSMRPVESIAVAIPGLSAVTVQCGSGTGVPPSEPGVIAVPVSGS